MLSTPSSRLGPPLPVFILSVVATAACNLAGVAMSTCSPSVSSSSFHLTCVWAGSGQRTVKGESSGRPRAGDCKCHN